MSRTKGVVLWNAREAKEKCEEFVRDYAKMRSDLLDHFEHKGHVALKYADDWDGFFAYCKEKLKLESKPDTIRLQISTAQVSREVGVDVPMVISRHIAKLPPAKQKEVYDEVVGAREVAGQRSANQMEPDVRKVVRRELGIIEPPRPTEPEPVSNTNEPEETSVAKHNRKVDEHYRDMGIATPAEQMAALRDGPWKTAQEPRTDDVEAETANQPAEVPMIDMDAYSEARRLLMRWSTAYSANDQEGLLAVYTDTRAFIAQ